MSNITLTFLILAASVLYASVGHGGASGYLAAMALLGITPEIMKPTALTLNILVAAIATFKFYRTGYFSGSIFFPFAIASVPFAFLGGRLSLPSYIYKPVVGLILLWAAYLLFFKNKTLAPEAVKPISITGATLAGIGIGLLSGLTGVGGGIFLSPLLLFMGWTQPKQTAAISAPFILVNSIAGLLGHFSSVATLPSTIYIWTIAAVIGGWIGAEYGSRRLGNLILQRLLALVLLIAGLKMIFS